MFFLFPNLKEQQKSGKSLFTVSYLFSSRVARVERWVVSDQKMPPKAVEINQNQ